MPKASVIQRMFSGVAPRYDILNHFLSLGIDGRWRKEVARSLELGSEDRVLDLCCGTGDLALAIAPRVTCFACDFTWEMLTLAQKKALKKDETLHLAAADALALPFPKESFDAVTVAFGVRNLEDLELGLGEFYRVLRRGGAVAILEFTRPRGLLLRIPYAFYLHVILPLIGRLVSAERGAYRYLADSIAGFPDTETLSRKLTNAGYSEVKCRLLTGGIVAIHRGRKT